MKRKLMAVLLAAVFVWSDAMAAWNAALPANNEKLVDTPAEIRANWDAIALGTDSALQITNAKVAAAAAIAWSKMAAITAGSVILGNGSAVPTVTAISGLFTLSSSGVASFTSGATITSPTVSGVVTLPENGDLLLDAALSADGKYCGITEDGTAGTTLAFGDLVYLAVADSRWELTDADSETISGPVKVGICVLAAAADGSATRVLLVGKIRADAKFPTMTIGAPVYVSGTAGAVTSTAPSSTDTVQRIVGYANTGDELDFFPNNGYTVHT